jgi:excisionase family DNA binding protein
MTAPTSTHDLAALEDRLRRRINDAMVRLDAEISAEIAAIAQAQADRPAVQGVDMGGSALTPTEAARLLGRSRSWVHDRIRDKTIPAVRVGTRWLLLRRSLQEGGWC